METTDYRHVTANGIDFALREQGTGPLVLCLHGFPDTAHTFDGLLPVLAANGYRAVAPFMRGYYPTGLAPDGDYSVPALGDDVLALMDALDEERAILVGHDWGCLAAIMAANRAPQRVSRLVAMSVCHMAGGAMTLAQLRRSWYVLFFQLPILPERIVARRRFAFIDRLYRQWSPHWDPAAFDLAPVKRALGMPGGLRAALAYYRDMVRGMSRERWRLLTTHTTVPTLVVAGEADGSVGFDQFQNYAAGYDGPVQRVSYPGVGHFPHREAPEAFQRDLLAFLKTPVEALSDA